jgi:hypothetical protein
MQPIDDGESPITVGLIGCRSVQMIAYINFGGLAGKDVVRDSRRRHRLRHPQRRSSCGLRLTIRISVLGGE